MTPSPQLRPAISAILTGKPPVELGVRNDVTTPLPDTVPLVTDALRTKGLAHGGVRRRPPRGDRERARARIRGLRPAEGDPFRIVPANSARATRSEVVSDFSKWVATLPEGASFFAWIQISRPGSGRRPATRFEPRSRVCPSSWRSTPPGGSRGRARRHGGQDRPRRRRAQRLLLERGRASRPADSPLRRRLAEARRSRHRRSRSSSSRSWITVEAGIAGDTGRRAPGGNASDRLDVARTRRVRVAGGGRGAAQGRRCAFTRLPAPTIDACLGPAPRSRSPTVRRACPRCSRQPKSWAEPAPVRFASQGADRPARPSGASRAPRALCLRVERSRGRSGRASWPRSLKARRIENDRKATDADAEYQKALARDPGNFGVLIEAGEALANGGHAKPARARLDRAIQLAPSHPEAWHWLGHVSYLESAARPRRCAVAGVRRVEARKRRRALRLGLLAIDHGTDRGVRCLPSPGVDRGIQRREQDPGGLRSPKPPGRPVVPPLHARGRALIRGWGAGLVAASALLCASCRAGEPARKRAARHARHDARRPHRLLRVREGGDPDARWLGRRIDPVRAGGRAEPFDPSQPQHDDDGAQPVPPRRALQRHSRSARARDDLGGAPEDGRLRFRGGRFVVRGRHALRPRSGIRHLRRLVRGQAGRRIGDPPRAQGRRCRRSRHSMVERPRRRQAVPVGAPLRRALPVRAAVPLLRRFRRSTLRRRDRERRP